MRFFILIWCLCSLVCQGQQKKIGDVIRNPDGSRGVVFWVAPDGSMGWMVALYDLPAKKAWGDDKVNVPVLPDVGSSGYRAVMRALSDTAGYGNTAKLREFQGPGTQYAAQCVDFEQGWYLPAVGQVRKLYTVMNDINPVLIGIGGSALKSSGSGFGDYVYSSSSEANTSDLWACSFADGQVGILGKNELLLTRQIRTFFVRDVEYDTTLNYRWNTGASVPFILDYPRQTVQYQVSVSSSVGCTNTATREVFVSSPDPVVIYDTICAGEDYRNNGFEASVAGTYEQVLENADGCDLYLTLKLTVLEPVETVIYDTICEGDLYTKNNFTEWEAGEYRQLWHGVSGCDSLVRLHLTVLPAFETVLYDTVCEGEDYDRNGFYLTGLQVGGHYFEWKGISRYDCDSVVYLHLTVVPVGDTLLFDTVCAGQYYKKHGFEYETVMDGQIREPLHLRSDRGCDSLVRLQLEVYPAYFFSDVQAICEGEQLEFRDRLLQEAGIYVDSLKTVLGCDSIYELQLSVNPLFRDTLKAVICEGQRYQDAGFNESEAGFYEKHYKTVNGCDSIVCLNLKVNSFFTGGIWSVLEDCATHSYRFEPEWKGIQTDKEGYRFLWDFGDGQTGEGEYQLHQYADSGTYPVRLQVVIPGNCSGEVQMAQQVAYHSSDIEIYARPENVDSHHPQIHLWTDSIPGMSYEWEFGDGHRATGTTVFHIYTFDEDVTYEVKLTRTNTENCSVEAVLPVHAFELISPPNTFSPNGDGVNDFFMKGYRIRIMNRNGVEIFKGEDGWDGTREGQFVPQDTYFYELYYRTYQGESVKRGYVTVVK